MNNLNGIIILQLKILQNGSRNRKKKEKWNNHNGIIIPDKSRLDPPIKEKSLQDSK